MGTALNWRRTVGDKWCRGGGVTPALEVVGGSGSDVERGMG